jgi:hypothetical protein
LDCSDEIGLAVEHYGNDDEVGDDDACVEDASEHSSDDTNDKDDNDDENDKQNEK